VQNSLRKSLTAARVVGRAPIEIRPFLELMRLDRPAGIWFAVLPGWIAAALAPGFPPGWRLPVVLLVSGLLTRAAGCTYNDLLDRRFDGHVPRTASRPLATGTVTAPEAWVFFVVQALVALLLPLLVNFRFFVVCAAGWVLYLAYPFMKRITDWPHLWIGPSMAWQAPAAWIALTGGFGLTGGLLYLGLACWGAGYDIVYGFQDREADVLVGVRSAPVRYGARAVPAIVVLYAATVLCLAAAGWRTGLGPLFWPVLALAAAHLARQLRLLDVADADRCRDVFLSNVRFAGLVLLAVLAGQAL
jgi:4-hydroxybenzoate polyprenyltransferase